jgi:C4-dicarboxylate-specific signal transduction histidine kinase
LQAELRDALDVYLTQRKLKALELRLFETERVYVELARQRLSNLQSKEETARVRAWLNEVDDVLAQVGQGVSQIASVVRGIELPTVEHADDLVDMADVIRLTLRLVSAELRRVTSLELDVRPVPLVRGASTLLGQVVLNLLVNAMHSVRERPRAQNFVSIRLSHGDGRVRFDIGDNGAILSESDLQSVFDPFFTPRYGRGAALGLAISKTIAEQHGGRLEVKSLPEGGALFSLVLPVAG